MTKLCPHCRTTKPVVQFYKSARGYSGWCKDCTRARVSVQVAAGYFKRGSVGRPKKARKILSPLDRLGKRLFDNICKRCRRQNRELDLTLEKVRDMLKEFCSCNYYTLVPRSPFLPSLDRLNSKKGYTETNTRVVWLIENYARNIFTDEDVLEFCRRKLEIQC